ncbi:MGA [Branchiostoma lanceolatum]|uniref:MGA protein n=1 Tax=Branchiostoma lanceolatum TaxID=7740 RepID=A0A8K0A1T7_BRALA|nr:MGA [Branchiostoma lanceolatum]
MDGDQPLDLSKGSPSKSGTQQTSAAASQARPPRPAAYTQPQVPHPHDKQYGSQPTSHMYGMERVAHRLPANTRPIGPHQLLRHHSQPQGGTPVGFAVPDRRALGMPGVDTKAGGPPNTHPPLYSTSAMGRPGQAVEILDSRQPYHPSMPMRPARSPVAPHTGTERAHSSQAPVRMPVDSRLMMGAAESSIRAMNPASHGSSALMPITAPVTDPTGARQPRKGTMPSSQSPNRLVAYSADLQRVQLSVSAQPVPANPPEFVTLRQCLVENRRLDGGSEMVNSTRTSKVVSDMISHSPRVAVSDQGDKHPSTSATTTVYSAQPTQHYPPDVINRLNRGMPHPALVAVQRQPNFHPSMAMQHGPRLSSPPPLIHAPRSGSSSGQKDDGAKSPLSSDSDQKRKTREIPSQATEYLRAAQMVPVDYRPPPPYVQHRQAHHFQGMQNSSEAAYKDRALPQYTTARQQQDYKGYAIQGVAMPPRVSTSEETTIPVQQYFMPAAHLSPRGSMAHRQPNGDMDMRRVQGDLRPTTVAHPPPLISVAGGVTNASFTQRGGTLTVSAQGSRGIPATSVQANASGYMPQQRGDVSGVTLVAQIVEKQLLEDGRQSGRAVPPAWRFKHRRDPVYQQVNGIPTTSMAPETSKGNIPDVIVIEDDSPPSSVKTDSEPQPTNTAHTREQAISEGFVGKRKSDPTVNPISKVMKGTSGQKVVPTMQVQAPSIHNIPPSVSANTLLFDSAVALTLQAETSKTLEKQIAQQIGTEKKSSAVSHINSLDPTRNIFNVFTSSSSETTQSSTQSKADYSESEQPLALTVKPSSTTTTSNYKKKRWNIDALKQKPGSGAENSSQVGHASDINKGANVYKSPGGDGGSLSTVQLTSKQDLSSSQSSQRQLTKSPEVPLKPIKPKQQWAHSRKLKEVEALQKDAEWQAGPSERSSVRQSKSLATAIIKSVIEDEEITSGKYKSSDPKTPKLPKKPKPKLESVEKKPPKPKEPQPSTSKVSEDEFSDFDDDEDDDDFDDDLEDFRRGKISEIVPDVDDIEGMLFMSFCSKDALHAHVAVEEKTRQEMGDKGREFLMDITKFKTLNLPPKTKRKLKEVGQAELFRHKGKHGMRGIHNRIRKYERMLKLELKALKTGKPLQEIAPIETQEQGELIPPEDKPPGVSKVKTPGSGKKIKKATTPGSKTGTPGKIKKKKVQVDGKDKTPGTKSGKKGKKLVTVSEKDSDVSLMAAIVVKEEIDTSITDEAMVTTELVPQSSSVSLSVTDVPKVETTPEKFLSKKGKTTDPTKIKGYKKKKKQKALTGEDIEMLENTPFEKLHWKTQERLLCCMTEEQIKERGLQAQVLRMKERKTEGFIPKKLRTKKRMKELEQSRSLEASTSGLPLEGEDEEEEQEILDDDSTDIYNFYGEGDDDDDLEKPEEIEQLEEELPSPPPVVDTVSKMGPELIGPAREEAGCKKSAFVSDELEKYLATEGETFSSKGSKVTFTHPLMHNKAENVAFQTPSKQGGFVKSLDSVVQKANFIKGTGQKAKSPLQHGTQIRIVNSKMVNRKPALLSKSLKPVPKKTSNTGGKSALSKLKASLMKSHPTARRASTTTATSGDVTVVSPTQAASAASALDESFEMGQSPTDPSQCGESNLRKPTQVLKSVKEPVYQMSSPRREEEFQEKTPCNNNFCRLGCVCNSIKDTGDVSSEKEHCGKVDCMFGCVCTEEEKAESRKRPRRPSESSMMYFDSVEQDYSPTTTKLLETDVLDRQEGGKMKSLKGKRTPGKKKNGGQRKSRESASEQTSGKESDSAGTSTSTDGREKKRKSSTKGQNIQPKKKRMVKKKAKSESLEGISAAQSKSSSKVTRKESEDGIKEQDMSEEGFLEDRFMDEDEEDALFIDDIGLDEMEDDEREDEDGDDGMTCARTRLYQTKVCQRKCMCKHHANSPEDERCEAEKEWSKIRAGIERRKAKEQKPGAGGSVTVMPNRKVQPYREFVYVGPRPPPPDLSPTARLPRIAPAPPPVPAPPPPAAPPTSAPAAAGAKSANGGKLIEIISDCNWESAKANILQTIAQHSQRNDGPRVMRVGNFLIEIMQPNPQGKIPIPAVPGAGPPAGMRFPVPGAVAMSPQGPARILPSSTITAVVPQSGMLTGGQVSGMPSATGTAVADAPQASTTAIVGKVALVQGADNTPDSLPNTESPLTSSKSPILQPIPRAVTSPVQNCTVQPTQDTKELQSPSAEQSQSIDEQEPPSLKRQPSVSSSSSCKPSSEAEEHPLAALRSLADSPFGTANTTVTVTSSPMGSAATSQTCHSSFSTTSPKCSIIENPRCRSRNDSGDATANDSLDPSSEQAKTANNSSHENSTEVSPCKDPSSLPELVPRPHTPPAPPEKRYSPSMPVLEPITPPRPIRDGGKSKLSCLEADAIAPHKPFVRESATGQDSQKEIQDGIQRVNIIPSLQKADALELPMSQGSEAIQEQCTEITSTSNQGEAFVEEDLENNNDLAWDTNQAMSLDNIEAEQSQSAEDTKDSKVSIVTPAEEEVAQPNVKNLPDQKLAEGERQEETSTGTLHFDSQLPSHLQEGHNTAGLSHPSTSGEDGIMEDMEIDIESLEDTEGSQADFLISIGSNDYSMHINPKCTLHNLSVKKKRKSPLKEKEVKADEVQFHEGALPPEPDEDEEALQREGPMRLIHKANERRRRSEMKDLFDKMKSVLGYDEEYKMSKYAVLKETVEEIGNLLEEEHDLLTQKHHERQTFEELAEKICKLAGQEMDDIMKTYWTASSSIWLDAKEPPPPVVRPKPPPPAPKLEFMPSSKPGSGSESGDRQDRPSRPSSTSSSSGSRPGTPTGSFQKGRTDALRTLRKVSTNAALQAQAGKVKSFNVTKLSQSNNPPQAAERSKPLILKTKPNTKNNKVVTSSPGAQLVTGNIMASGQPVTIPVATVMPQLIPSVKPTVTPVIISVQSLAVSSSQTSIAAQTSSSSAPTRPMAAGAPVQPVVPCVQMAPAMTPGPQLSTQPGTMVSVMQPVAQVQPNNTAVQPNQPVSGISMTSMSMCQQGQPNVMSQSTVPSSLSQTLPSRQLGTVPPHQGSLSTPYKPPAGQPVSNQTTASAGNQAGAKQPMMSSDMGTALSHGPPVGVVSASQTTAGSQGPVSGFGSMMATSAGTLQPKSQNMHSNNSLQGQGNLNTNPAGQIVTLAGKPGQFLVTPVSGPQGALLLQPIGRLPVSHGAATSMQNAVTTTSQTPGQGFAGQMTTSSVQLQQGQPIPHSLVPVSGGQPVQMNSPLTAAHSGIQLVALQRLPINLSQANVSASSQPVYLQVSPTLSNMQAAGNPLQTTVTSQTMQQISPLSPTAVRPLQLMASSVPQAAVTQASTQGITNLTPSQMHQLGSSLMRGPAPQMSPGMQTSQLRPVLPTLSTPNSPFQHNQSYGQSPSQQVKPGFQPDGSTQSRQVAGPSQNSTGHYLTQTAPSSVSSPGVDILSAAVCEAGLQSDFVGPQPPTATQQAASAPPSTELSTLSTVNVELLMPTDQPGDSSSTTEPGTFTDAPQPDYESF